MKIGQKMLIGAAALTLIPVAITATLLWQNSQALAEETVNNATKQQLQSLRDTKREQLEAEIEGRIADLRALASQRSTVEALRGFKQTFPLAAKELVNEQQAAVAASAEYMQKEFAKEFESRSGVAAPASAAEFVAKRDANGIALQHAFVFKNPNPVGQKERMGSAQGEFSYNKVHTNFHPGLEQAQKMFGFYDIFFIDTDSDQIIYSVFKELDFGTSLKDGIASNSKLSEAYQAVKQAGSKSDFRMTDFAPYLASYNDQAAFVAVPVFDGDKQIGVMAMQYPVEKITDVLSSKKAWRDIGLGLSGDVFAVGPDFLMRTNSRYMLEKEQQPEFLAQMKDKISPANQALMVKRQSTIGIVKIESEATKLAATGGVGFSRFTDFRGVEVVGAFGPMNAGGLQWPVVAKIDASEADASLRELNQSTFIRALLVALGVISVAGVGVALFLRQFLKPIQTLTDAVSSVSKGDLEARSKLVGKDEIGELGRSFDNLLDERIASLQKSAAENDAINNSVIALLQTVFQLSGRDLTARAPVTEDIIGTVSSSVNQLTDETAKTLAEVQMISKQVTQASSSVRQQAALVEQTAARERDALAEMATSLNAATEQLVQVAALSDTSNQAAAQTSASTQAALGAVRETVQGMEVLRESMSDMEKRFKRLGERSQEISSAVNLINTISERTHVLALNASMQAATAGEAGRGFAVVAEEVQRLSDSSRQATAQIAQLVSNIQAETNETLFTVNRLISDVVKQTDSAQRAGVQMTQTQSNTEQLVALVQQIAGFSASQTELAQTLQASVREINEGTQQTSSAIENQSKTTQLLGEVAQQLSNSVGQFRLPGDAQV